MTTIKLNRLPKTTVEITATIPNSDIKTEYEVVMKKTVEETELPGFRKGKAPRDMVEKNIDRAKIATLIIRNLIPKAYSDAVKEHDLHPIIDPTLEIQEPKELIEILDEADLKLKITTCEAPSVKLNDYKEKIKAESAKDAIWTPDKGAPDKNQKEESPEIKEQKKFVRNIDILLKTCNVEIGELVIKAEANRLLSQTLDEIKKLGLTLEEYLKNTGKTADNLQAEAKTKAESSLKISFIFDEIAQNEKITVEKSDIDAIIAKATDSAQKAQIQANSYQLAPIILRQKVVDFLNKL